MKIVNAAAAMHNIGMCSVSRHPFHRCQCTPPAYIFLGKTHEPQTKYPSAAENIIDSPHIRHVTVDNFFYFRLEIVFGFFFCLGLGAGKVEVEVESSSSFVAPSEKINASTHLTHQRSGAPAKAIKLILTK